MSRVMSFLMRHSFLKKGLVSLILLLLLVYITA